MATLNGKTLKDTYTGILKTSDQAGIDGTSKTIETGDGASTALSLSDTEVEVNTLKITTLASGSSDTDMLTVNSSGEVRKKTITDNALSVSHEADSTSDPVVTFTQGGSDYPIQFKGIDGVDVVKKTSGANAVVEISADNVGVNTTTFASAGSRTINASQSGTTFIFNIGARASGTSSTNQAFLPPAAAGLRFRFILDGGSPNLKSTEIVTQSGDFLDGAIQIIYSDGKTKRSTGNGTSNTTLEVGGRPATGGAQGDFIEFLAVDSTKYVVTGVVNNVHTAYASGTASAFSD